MCQSCILNKALFPNLVQSEEEGRVERFVVRNLFGMIKFRVTKIVKRLPEGKRFLYIEYTRTLDIGPFVMEAINTKTSFCCEIEDEWFFIFSKKLKSNVFTLN